MAQRDDPSPAEPGPQRWFVVANASRARAYVQRVGAPGYDVVRAWDHPDARMTAADAGEEGPGGDDGGQRVGVLTTDPEASPKGPVQRDLERALVEDLAQALRRRELSGLYLVAPAPLLHRLRDALPSDLRGGSCTGSTRATSRSARPRTCSRNWTACGGTPGERPASRTPGRPPPRPAAGAPSFGLKHPPVPASLPGRDQPLASGGGTLNRGAGRARFWRWTPPGAPQPHRPCWT